MGAPEDRRASVLIGDDTPLDRKVLTVSLEAQGYLVLRFWNNDVLQNINGVLQTIVDTASPEPPHPNPLPAGEREHA